MANLLPFIIVGLTTGSIYGLAGVGLVLTYKTSGIFNFGYGALATVAAYSFYELWVTLGIPWQAALPITLVVLCIVLGLLLERFASRLTKAPLALQVVGTVGLILLVESFYYITYGPAAILFPSFLPSGSFQFAGVYVGYNSVIIVAVSTLVTAGLFLFFRTTQLGRQMRAVVDDPTLVDLTGTNANHVRRWAWVIGVFLVSLSGILLAPAVDLDPQVLTLLIVQAFGAAAIGGFTSLPLTWAGGIGIGLAASITTKYVNSTTSVLSGIPPSIPFLILFAVILFRHRDKVSQTFSSASQTLTSDRWRAPARAHVIGGLAVLLFLIFVPDLDPLHLSNWTQGLTVVLLLLSLGLLVRLSGQVSLCQVSFAAIGAAAFSHIAQAGIPWVLALIIAGLAAVPLGALLAVPAIRLSGLYLALATFGFALLLQDMFYQSNLMFGSSDLGITMPRPSFASSDSSFYYVVLIVTGLAILAVVAVSVTRLGRLLGGMSESESAIAVCGGNVTLAKIAVFCLSAFLAAIAGALSGMNLAVVTGANYSPVDSLTYIAVIVIAVGGVPWYAIPTGIGLAVIPAYITSTATGYYLQLIFGLSAIAVGCGFRTPTPARMRSLATRLDGGPKRSGTVLSADTPHVSNGQSAGAVKEVIRLEVDGLTVSFGGLRAVDHFSFKTQTGAITGLIGPNGAGKTTTFNACSGLVPISDGQVTLGGENITKLGLPERAQRGLGRTFQRIDLLDSYTAKENVELAAEAALSGAGMARVLVGRRNDEAEVKMRAHDALDDCGLQEVADIRAGALSNRQRRLLSVARCLAADFRIVMLDEPSAGLDANETVEFGTLLVSIVKNRGMGIVLVEHDMSLVMKVCDEIYVLDFGKSIMHGTPEEVRAHPDVRAAYLGEESLSFAQTSSKDE